MMLRAVKFMGDYLYYRKYTQAATPSAEKLQALHLKQSTTCTKSTMYSWALGQGMNSSCKKISSSQRPKRCQQSWVSSIRTRQVHTKHSLQTLSSELQPPRRKSRSQTRTPVCVVLFPNNMTNPCTNCVSHILTEPYQTPPSVFLLGFSHTDASTHSDSKQRIWMLFVKQVRNAKAL